MIGLLMAACELVRGARQRPVRSQTCRGELGPSVPSLQRTFAFQTGSLSSTTNPVRRLSDSPPCKGADASQNIDDAPSLFTK